MEAARKICSPSIELKDATVCDLRRIVMNRVLDCHGDGGGRASYVRLLKALSFTSCLNLLRGMSREELLRILGSPCECAE